MRRFLAFCLLASCGGQPHASDAGNTGDAIGGSDIAHPTDGTSGLDATTIPDGTSCVPQCSGRVCGDNGCGGQCGVCTGGEACTSVGQCCSCGAAPTPMPITFTAMPASPDFRAPGRGAEQWHDGNEVDVPAEGSPQPALDVYRRSFYKWYALEPAMGTYDLSVIENDLHDAIDHRQKWSMGLMTVYPDDSSSGVPHASGVGMTYPLYLHQLMQNASDPRNHGATDWNNSMAGWWLPNYNSEYYLDRFDALNAAINTLLMTGSYHGVNYRDIVNDIDVRGFGPYGEWHHAYFIDSASSPDGAPGSWPVGMRPTETSLERIVDSYVRGYPQFQLVAMMAAFDAHWFENTWNPPEIAQHILDARNSVGPLGWRRDQWGSSDAYPHDYLENNNRSVPGGEPFHIAIMNRWQQAPIVGEPECSGVDMALLPDQVTLYHASRIGNSNYCTSVSAALATNVREASRRMGYRLVLNGGSAPIFAMGGQSFPISLDWQNIGIAPTYERWVITFELQDRATRNVVWSAPSSHQLRLFLPATAATTVRDDVALPTGLATGTYRLVVRVVDPTGYRDPLPLAITGRNTDGSYTLVDSFTVGMCGGC